MGGAPYKSAKDGGGHSSVRLWYQQKRTSYRCTSSQSCPAKMVQRHTTNQLCLEGLERTIVHPRREPWYQHNISCPQSHRVKQRMCTYLRKNPFSPALGTTVEEVTIKWDSNFGLNCVACKFTFDFVNVVHNVASTAKNSLLHLQHWDRTHTHTLNGYYLLRLHQHSEIS